LRTLPGWRRLAVKNDERERRKKTRSKASEIDHGKKAKTDSFLLSENLRQKTNRSSRGTNFAPHPTNERLF
jgi:hypothetical protein